MTGARFYRWLREQQNFDIQTKEPFNSTWGVCLEITNTTNNLFTYFSGPFDEREIPDRDIIDTCTQLGNGFPPGF